MIDLPTAVVWGAAARLLARDLNTVGRRLHTHLTVTGRRLLGQAVLCGLNDVRRTGDRWSRATRPTPLHPPGPYGPRPSAPPHRSGRTRRGVGR